MNLDNTFCCKNVIENSEVFQLNFAKVTVVTGMNELVPSVDNNISDIVVIT